MFDFFPILETDRLLLRQFTDSDIDNIFRGLSHPDVIKYYGVNYSSLEATKEQIDWFADIYNTKSGIWWAICDKRKIFLGSIGVNNINFQHQKAEIGFWLLPEYWGNGFVLEAAVKMITFLYDNSDIHRIEGFVESKNQNSQRLMKKLNFIHEGTMRDCEIKNGNYISLEIFAMIKD